LSKGKLINNFQILKTGGQGPSCESELGFAKNKIMSQDYKVIEADSADELKRRVNDACRSTSWNDGNYKVTGGVEVTKDSEGKDVYRQAVVKDKD
jgi:hypothetical protein